MGASVRFTCEETRCCHFSLALSLSLSSALFACLRSIFMLVDVCALRSCSPTESFSLESKFIVTSAGTQFSRRREMNLITFLLTAFCCRDYFFPEAPAKTKSLAGRDFRNPHFGEGREAIVQLFEWKWSDIALECENFLAVKGFGGVQVSPPNENVILASRPWYERYQPISYLLATRSGDEKSFLDMTRRCNAVGVRIYADVVFNHMAADQQNRTAVGTGGSTAIPDTRDYSAVPYNVTNFHPLCALVDYNDAYQVRNCELVGLHDLNQTVEDTRDKIVDFLNHLIDLGVAGFRVDAAKHQWPNDLSVIYNRLKTLNSSFGFEPNSDPFIYQEVIDMGGEAVSKYEYTFAVVSEFRYSMELSRSFTGHDDLKWLVGFGEQWDLLPSELALVFIDNHDSQRGGGILNYKTRKNYTMAQVFSLAHPYGIKRIMSSFAFNKSNQGPPADDSDNILSPTIAADGNCTNGWICEHRWRPIASMVAFMGAVRGENVTSWWDNGGNQIAFSRGSKGFVAFNLDINDVDNISIKTDLNPGIYCDIITGERTADNECSGRYLVVSEQGEVLINLPSDDESGIIATHVNQKLSAFVTNSLDGFTFPFFIKNKLTESNSL